jgi:magnesium-transporting ATPase (P-type)
VIRTAARTSAAAPRAPAAGEAGALARAARLDAEHLLAELGTSREGLTGVEAATRLAREGPNRLPEARGPSLARQLFEQMFYFFAVMLWVAAGLAFVGGMPQLGVAIIIVIVLNGLFSFAQEYRAERAIRALSALLPEAAVVRRDGRKAEVPAAELVPGDLVLLREGDRISADARVLRSAGLKVDNSMLTGESEPVPRRPAPRAAAWRPRGRRQPGVRRDVRGLGVGDGGGGGHGAPDPPGRHLRAHRGGRPPANPPARGAQPRGPGHRRVRGGVRGAVPWRVAAARRAVERRVPVLRRGDRGAGARGTAADAVAVAGDERHQDGQARRPGTPAGVGGDAGLHDRDLLRQDRHDHRQRDDRPGRRRPRAPLRASGSGYDPRGTLLADGRPLSAAELERATPLLRVAALCTDARVERVDGRWRCVGDPTEGALVVLARKGGVERGEAERTAHRVREFPFESARQRMSTVHTLPSGAVEVLVKGSPEAILRACSWFREEDRVLPLRPEVEAAVLADVERLAQDGFRVLAFARREAAGPRIPRTPGEAERDLELLGLVGMADPVRPEVPGAVARCRKAGIRVMMITGDHPATARSVAAKAGLATGRVLLGSELPADDRALSELLADPAVAVLARVPPEVKLRIARALQSLGNVVAMTGDGVNDAPALRQADIGIAMGVVGTDVAREAADFVLLDDNFAHIVQAVEEGRAAFDNTKRFLTYHLTHNVAELTPFLAWALSAGRIPLMITCCRFWPSTSAPTSCPPWRWGPSGPSPA